MAGRLEEYNQKRDFQRTGEPEGETLPDVPGSRENLSFVVQRHMARAAHYDFRLEWDGALLSWAVPKGPSYDIGDRRLAVQVEDHPLEYRNFEGTIPKGEYGGGTVMLWDEGTWEPLVDVKEGLDKGTLKFVLKGRRLKGKWALVRLAAKAGETKNNWLLLKEKDAYARKDDGISVFNTSIRTGRTLTEIEDGKDAKIIKNPFSLAEVQLAKLVRKVPVNGDWLYELKYDGYRIVAYLEGGSVRLLTRGGHDYTGRFQNVASSLADWAAGRTMVLDGEMTVIDAAGRTDFQALQSYVKKPAGQSLTYIIFDLLALDGVDLRGRRLIDRKETLEALMTAAPANLYFSKHIKGSGEESFRAACQANLEGIVGKRADSVYSGTRNGDWIKLKCDTRQEFVIGGYTRSEKKAGGVSALLLGVYEGQVLRYAGRAGTGFTERTVKELEQQFEMIRREAPPFISAPKPRANERITWLEPLLVAEIKFAEWTEDHLLRQASFKGLRSDKKPGDIRMEHADEETPPDEKAAAPMAEAQEKPMKQSGDNPVVAGVKITNPDKVIFDEPEIKKLDVVRYYEAVSERMLPYVRDRVLSIVRCPMGISQTCFYKKHPGPDSKGVVTLPILSSSGETEEYFYIENTSGIVYEAQMGTLEFHTWGSRVDTLEKPDVMVFDLDPDEGMNLDAIRRGVIDLKGILARLSLISYLKTSGGKGYHVVVPFKPSASWDAFRDFSRHVAEVMEMTWPDRYTSNIRKAKRSNKIFIDWIRNGRGATSVAPYSVRARKGARVSMPIAWEELDTVAPDGVTMADALRRIDDDDPWKDFFSNDQFLK